MDSIKQDHPEIRRSAKRALLVFLALALLSLALSCAKTVTIAGEETAREAAALDLRNHGVASADALKGIRKLHELTALDLRDNPLTRDAFDEIQHMLPKCEVRWNVPLSQGAQDSAAEALSLESFTQDDVSLLAYFPRLASVDVPTGDPAAMIAAAAQYPDVSFTWTVTAAGKTFSSTDAAIICAAGTRTEDVEMLLRSLPGMRTLDLRQTDLLASDVAALESAHPTVGFLVNALLLGKRVETGAAEADLSGAAAFDADALLTELASFPKLTLLNLRELSVSAEDVAQIQDAYPAIHVRWDVPLLENLTVDSDIESLDLRGYTVSDLPALQKQLGFLTKLSYLDMCYCGPSDEEMAALREALPSVKVVWMLHIGKWDVRTDIKAFSMAQVKEHDGVRFTKVGDEKRRYRWVTNEEIAKIRYCTDIIALDIGHSLVISDISFVKEVPTLKYLVLARTAVTDISAVASLKNLIFFETFGCKLTDVSALYSLPQLQYYNCSANYITDIGPLLSLKNLKRLWIIKCRFTKEQLQQIKHGLPDTIIMAYGQHQTDNGWRYDNPEYLVMQDLFGLKPQLDWIRPGYLDPNNQIP